MKYNRIFKGIFLKRPNRFIAYVNISGNEEVVHVKNTGRCRELLTDNANVLCEKSDNPNRKTQYDLVAVYKGDRLLIWIVKPLTRCFMSICKVADLGIT